MGVNHRRVDVGVAKQLLDGSNIVTLPEQLGGKRVTQRVAAGKLVYTRDSQGLPERALGRSTY